MNYKRKFLITIAALLSLIIARYVNNSLFYNANREFLNQKKEADENRLVFVQRVIDGDTVVLANGDRIRYIGINTPELHHPQKGAEYYAKEALNFNKELVLGKPVRLEFDKERFDRYGRTLAYVYLEDGTFVNKELVKRGYARTMAIKPNT